MDSTGLQGARVSRRSWGTPGLWSGLSPKPEPWAWRPGVSRPTGVGGALRAPEGVGGGGSRAAGGPDRLRAAGAPRDAVHCS